MKLFPRWSAASGRAFRIRTNSSGAKRRRGLLNAIIVGASLLATAFAQPKPDTVVALDGSGQYKSL